MRVAFISYGQESLGFQYLSAHLKMRGHHVKLFYDPCVFDDKLLLHYPRLNNVFSFKKWVFKALAEYQPDLVGIAVLTDTFPWAREMARRTKELLPGVRIVVGGTHVTILPERVAEEPYFDFLVLGEGEIPMAELTDSLEARDGRTDIPGVWFRQDDNSWIKNNFANTIEDLAFFGQPDRTIYEPYVNVSKTFMAVSARGCVYSCSFCHHNALKKIYEGKGKYLRRLTPEQFVGYLKEGHERYKYRTLQIYDEIFTYDLPWLQKFSDLYRREINVPHISLGHPNHMSEEVILALKASNCVGVQIGVQSLKAETRTRFLQRNEKDVRVMTMIKDLEKHKLPYQLDMIFGLPGDVMADYHENAQFFSNCKAASKINTLILSLQPQTDIVDHAIEVGMICEADKASIDAGEEGCRVGESGSLRDKKQHHMIQNYMLMYRIAVLFPKWITTTMLKSGIYKYLRYGEPFLGHAVRLYGADQRDILYVHHHVRYAVEWVTRKLFGRSLWRDQTSSSPESYRPSAITSSVDCSVGWDQVDSCAQPTDPLRNSTDSVLSLPVLR